jgi:hypothetical protein
MATQTEKEVAIIVNGRPKKVAPEVSYDEIVNLAFNNNPPSGPNIIITVTYRHGNEQGSLAKGQSPVTVKAGTIFDVRPSDKS